MVAGEDSRKGNEYGQWQETNALYDSSPTMNSRVNAGALSAEARTQQRGQSELGGSSKAFNVPPIDARSVGL